MANRQKNCKVQKSDSACTCGSNQECLEDTNTQKPERNINKDVASVYNTKNYECSTECTNCKLLNRLYVLLEEIVEHRKISSREEANKSDKNENNDTKKLLKNNNEEIPTKKENLTKLLNNDVDVKKCNVPKVYHNNTLMLCDCDKTETNQDKNSNCLCMCNKVFTIEVPKGNESSAQYWYSVGEIKKQNQVDSACQCTYSKKDSCTQDYCMQKAAVSQTNKDDLNNCIDSAVNTDTQNISSVQNLYWSLLNDPTLFEALKLMHCPNVVVLSNGCSCNSKSNTPLEKTSVTTNTSKIILSAQEKNDEIAKLQKFTANEIYQSKRLQSILTFPKLNESSQEASITNNEFSIGDPTSYIKTQGLSSTNENGKDLLRTPVKNKDLINDTTFMVPQGVEMVVASALVPKNGKKKGTPKSKKRKSKDSSVSKESTEKKDFINMCCQTDKNVTENVLQTNKKTEENVYSYNCTDIKNFVEIITQLYTQINKNKDKSDEKVHCKCKDKSSSAEAPVASVNNNTDDCLQIQRLAEQIAEIHLKLNQNKNGSQIRPLRNDSGRSVLDLPKTTNNSDCDLDNCILVNSIPSPGNISDNTEQCYCKVCPCKKATKIDKKDVYPTKKEKRCVRSSTSPTPKKATRKLNELEYANLNKWIRQYPSESPQKCTCSNCNCMDETEIECLNYNVPECDNCNEEKCPQLRRIIKECMCDTKNCYCHNPKLNELKTTAKLEHLADQVINTITACNCMGQQCACNNTIDPGTKRNSTRQVCFSSIYHENQREITNHTDKEKKLFDTDANGDPCLHGSKLETNLHIKNILNTTKPTNKKVISLSARKLKSLMMKPILPIPVTPCTQINCINSLFSEVYQKLSKIKELTNWEILPQEIVEMVIDKILKREIKSALQQMKVIANDGTDNKNNTNILNILLEDNMNSEENVKEFKNNILLGKSLKYTKQTSHVDKYIQHYYCKETLPETIHLTEDSNNNIQNQLETFNINQKDFDTKKKSILVQINIEKEKMSLPEKKNKISVENSCVSLKGGVSSSSIYITENKLGAIKDLITLGNNIEHQNWEDNATDSTSVLSFNEAKQPISININIQMDKESNLHMKDLPSFSKKIHMKDSFINTDTIISKDSSTFSLSKEDTNESMQINKSECLKKSSIEIERINKFNDVLQEKNKSMDDQQEKRISINHLQEKKIFNVDLQETTCKNELPSLKNFLAMNQKIKVQKIKIAPKNINKLK